MTKPSEFHKQGYTCAEAIIKSYNEEFETNIPVAIGSGMGTGYTVGSLCGAIGASAAVIGMIKGRESNEDANEARACSKELMTNITEEFKTLLCKELKSNKVACATIIDYSYDVLKKVLDK